MQLLFAYVKASHDVAQMSLSVRREERTIKEIKICKDL